MKSTEFSKSEQTNEGVIDSIKSFAKSNGPAAQQRREEAYEKGKSRFADAITASDRGEARKGFRDAARYHKLGGGIAGQVGSGMHRAFDLRDADKIMDSSINEDDDGDWGTEPFEAYGIRGVKRLPWRKMFKNGKQAAAWCEKYDAEIHGMREVDVSELPMSMRPKQKKEWSMKEETNVDEATAAQQTRLAAIKELGQDLIKANRAYAAAKQSGDTARAEKLRRIISKIAAQKMTIGEDCEPNEGADEICMTVPLFIRCLEWAKENAPDDVALHKFTENVVAQDGCLDIDAYDSLVPGGQVAEDASAGGTCSASISSGVVGAIPGKKRKVKETPMIKRGDNLTELDNGPKGRVQTDKINYDSRRNGSSGIDKNAIAARKEQAAKQKEFDRITRQKGTRDQERQWALEEKREEPIKIGQNWDFESLRKAAANQAGAHDIVDIMDMRNYRTRINGTIVAGIEVSVVCQYDPNDFGYDGGNGDGLSDSVSLRFARDPQNPKKIVFTGYGA